MILHLRRTIIEKTPRSRLHTVVLHVTQPDQESLDWQLATSLVGVSEPTIGGPESPREGSFIMLWGFET